MIENEMHPEGFDVLIKKIAARIATHVNSTLGKDTWRYAYLYIRGCISKLRVELLDGTTEAIFEPDEDEKYVGLTVKARELEKDFPERWHGLKLSIFRDRKYNLEFTQDVSDPTFFTS